MQEKTASSSPMVGNLDGPSGVAAPNANIYVADGHGGTTNRSPILSGSRAPTPGVIARSSGFGNKYKVNSK
jgi:hypothetical protein